ncbi:uncharacterized protein LOC128989432 [Macrosteles quadrilineatus]|uniref:uncharacterized protein LOC128989432 n=1 Tax=Macrosteles quadrilineatus TaxID=74068 RepID=UPI0023E13DED|nr:uncharacterized protein LOC128989432 [Macrosteles quadrilineatus]
MARNPIVRLDNNTITFVNKVKYLGVTLDHNLTFSSYVKEVSEKAINMFNSIARTIRLKYGVRFSQLKFLYTTVFLSILSYGSRAWEFRIGHTHVKRKIREAQRRVLICITTAYCTTPLQALCAATGNMPIDIKLQMDLDLWKVRKGLLLDSKNDVIGRHLRQWQEEWDRSDTGRPHLLSASGDCYQ